MLDWVAQLTATKPEPTVELDEVVDASGPVDLLAAALSGNSQMVTEAATATSTTRGSRDRGASNQRVPGNGSLRKSGPARSIGTTKQPVPAGQPGGWLTTAGTSVSTSLIDKMTGEETEEGMSDDDRGGGGRRAIVETATVGVQWEDMGGAVDVPISSPSGRLPPWAKPYAPACPTTDGVECGGSEDDLRVVAVVSSGIQCGESVLGG